MFISRTFTITLRLKTEGRRRDRMKVGIQLVSSNPLLRLTTSDYIFGIFNLFYIRKCPLMTCVYITIRYHTPTTALLLVANIIMSEQQYLIRFFIL
jgi:hypothetical protein